MHTILVPNGYAIPQPYVECDPMPLSHFAQGYGDGLGVPPADATHGHVVLKVMAPSVHYGCIVTVNLATWRGAILGARINGMVNA